MKMDKRTIENPSIPEAPIFKPTAEEFKDPLKYIQSITTDAERYGICKVIPPDDWHPPFMANVEEFRFIPRIQQLNKLEAQTRLNVLWMENLQIFWRMLGPLSIPVLQGQQINLYQLNELIEEKNCIKNNKTICDWHSVASKLGLNADDRTTALLRYVYEELILPMNKLSSIDSSTEASDKENVNNSEDPPVKRRKKGRPRKVFKNRKVVSTAADSNTGGKIINGKCSKCNQIIMEDDAFESCCCDCGSCKEKFHVPCVSPAPKVPISKKWSWWCKKCVSVELNQGSCLTFGFEDADQSFDLGEFGERADIFKAEYFGVNQPDDVSEKKVEQEFWKLVTDPESTLKVMYGADLHVLNHGSGFPSSSYSGSHSEPNFNEYLNSGWNLNNLATLPESLLRFINADMSGMKIPWMYVGMCFSSFCWHNEDHWSSSINYLHFGSTKTWYGVPGREAAAFEARMKETAPALFKYQPDILHQLVTLLHPAHFMSANINVFRADQRAGEFVITFPRAYHAGFNHGFNFAEAVNFATSAWLRHGFESIGHYSEHKRKCVFSHEEMLCEMARDASSLQLEEALEAHTELCLLLDEERQFKEMLKRSGVKRQRRVLFENYEDDDDRSCVYCNTTLFLSAITCSCKQSIGKLFCRKHYNKLCNCSPSKFQFLFRYTLNELEEIAVSLLNRATLLEKRGNSSVMVLRK